MMKKNFFILPFVFFTAFVQGQSVYNRGALISIKPNTIFSITDSLVNNGEITNNGSILISGGWINNSVYDAGEGQIAFNSSAPQIINHNDQSFSKLTISGGGEKIFQANITIENQLNLTDGVLRSENGAAIIFAEGATIIGGSDAAHIDGPVYQQGAGDKIFPVGNGIIYLPVEIKNITGSAAEVTVTLRELQGASLLKSNALDAISNSRYWEVNAGAGVLNDSKIVLPIRDEDIVTNTEEVVVTQSSALTVPFESLGRSAYNGTVTNGSVTSNLAVASGLVAIGIESSSDKTIVVYNAVSPNNDGLNEFLRILNIEKYPGNVVSIFNRWGDKVYEGKNYDNNLEVFRGKSNLKGDKELPPATYFYVIDKNDGSEKVTGYLSLKFTY